MNLLEYCKNLPKVELHAHLNGSLSQETLISLGVAEQSLKGYQIIHYVSENNQEKLNECFKLFKVAHAATKTIDSVFKATKHTIEEFHKDNVIYLELRTTPRQEENMSKKEYIQAVVRAVQENKNSIVVKLILSIDRIHDFETSQKALDLIIEMQKLYPNIIKGVDLCGNPRQGNFSENLFVKARENGLKVTLHCAEVKNDEEVARMLMFKPERIGHATFVHPNYGGSDELWDLYRKLPIPTECCLTSNVLCGTSKNYQEHHVKEWIRNGLPFCLNTDDKGVFDTSSSEEHFHAAENLNMSRNSLIGCSLSGIEYSFASNEEKQKLKKLLLIWKEQQNECP